MLLEVALALTQAVFLLTLALLVAGRFGLRGKYLELAAHFRLQYLIACFICCALFFVFGAWLWAAASAACFIAVGAALFPYYVPRESEPAAAARFDLRLLLFNVNYQSKRYAEFLALIATEQPDIVIAQEVTERWTGALAALSAEFPHSEVVARAGGAGIALYSRLPFAHAETVVVGNNKRPGIMARIELQPGAFLSLFTFHPPAPLRPGHFEYRNEQLVAAGPLATALPEPRVVMGDFNVTLWSPYFSRLLAASGLVNARMGYGILPTWPTWHRIAWLMLPIDHCLVSSRIEVRDLRVGPRIGSDHLPLIAELSVPAAG